MLHKTDESGEGARKPRLFQNPQIFSLRYTKTTIKLPGSPDLAENALTYKEEVHARQGMGRS